MLFRSSLGKSSIISKDHAGFIVNRLLIPFMLDAMQAAANGVGNVQDIDTAMELGLNHPMGPLMLADFIGLDVIFSASKTMFDEYKDSRYAPPPVLKNMVLSGTLGLKSGRGFYNWTDVKNPVPVVLN